MNRFLKLAFTIPFFLLTISLNSCSSNKGKNQTAGMFDSSEEGKKGNPKFSDKQIEKIFFKYISFKDALVEGDSIKGVREAEGLVQAFEDAGLKDNSTLTKKLMQSKSLSIQRALLDTLTSVTEKAIKPQLASGEIFKQYCPMANNGKGAFWLAAQSTIRNPYYGKEMLECGEVKEVIK